MISHLRPLTVALLLLLSASVAQAAPKAKPTPVQEILLLDSGHHEYVVMMSLQEGMPVLAVIDTGTTEMSLPEDVWAALMRTGLLTEDDRLPPKPYTLADGRTRWLNRFNVSITLGTTRLRNVPTAINYKGTPVLLGTNVLNRFSSFGIDHVRSILRLGVPR